jgi:hypothetical protein
MQGPGTFDVNVPASNVAGVHYQADVHVWDVDGSQQADTLAPWQGAGNVQVASPLTFQNGHTYDWYAQTWNGSAYSEPTATCSFKQYFGSPSTPTVTDPDFPPVGTPGYPTKIAGQSTTFTISGSTSPLPSGCAAAGSPDCQVAPIDHYVYGIDQQPATVGAPSVPADSNGSASLTLTVNNWGVHNLYVYAVNAAGDLSVVPASYTFYVPWQFGPQPSSVSPSTGQAHTSTILTVVGKRLAADSQVSLTRQDGSTPVKATTLGLNPDGSLSARVDLTGVATGPWDVTVANDNGTFTSLPGAFTVTTEPVQARYVALPPTRILDTRSGLGAPEAAVGAGQQVALQVLGRGGVPSSGVTAVVLNVTATGGTASSVVTVYPEGGEPPVASNVNFSAGETIANLVTVGVGPDGKVDLYNHAGSVNLIADVAGYYTTSATTGARFVGLTPARILDTRSGLGAPKASVTGGHSVALQVLGRGGVPSRGVTAVVMNVTAVAPTASGFVTAYPDGIARPTASTLDFSVNQTIPNLVTVRVGTDGKVDLYNHAGSVNVIADVAGYYTTSTTTGARFVPVTPTRVLDTRYGIGAPKAALGPDQTLPVQFADRAGLPLDAKAVVVNVTATAPTTSGFVTVYPDGKSLPTASNLNFSANETIPNLVVVPLVDGELDFHNHSGNVQLVGDVVGYFVG